MRLKLITERSFAAPPHPLAGRAGTEEALAAAKAGNVAEVNRLEIAWLNAPRVRRPIPPEGVPEQDLAACGYKIHALEIVRRGDVTQILWGYQDHDEADPIWTFRTDMELNFVPDSIEDAFDPWDWQEY